MTPAVADFAHLPECPVIVYEAIGTRYVVAPDLCICWRLRAAEDRVRQSLAQQSCDQHLAQWEVESLRQACRSEGYAKGIQAAHDAVAALKGDWVFGPRIYKHEALTAIKKLRRSA